MIHMAASLSGHGREQRAPIGDVGAAVTDFARNAGLGKRRAGGGLHLADPAASSQKFDPLRRHQNFCEVGAGRAASGRRGTTAQLEPGKTAQEITDLVLQGARNSR